MLICVGSSGTFTRGEAQQAAVSDKRLYQLRDAGEIVALGGGVYRWADAPPADDDLVEIAERVPAGTLCLETALARHGLIDTIPAAIDVAVPRGSTRPALRAPVRLHQFDRATFGLGREQLDVGARRAVGIYSAERSIIDVIRLRHREGSDLAWEALRRWLAQPGRSQQGTAGRGGIWPGRHRHGLPRREAAGPPVPAIRELGGGVT